MQSAWKTWLHFSIAVNFTHGPEEMSSSIKTPVRSGLISCETNHLLRFFVVFQTKNILYWSFQAFATLVYAYGNDVFAALAVIKGSLAYFLE